MKLGHKVKWAQGLTYKMSIYRDILIHLRGDSIIEEERSKQDTSNSLCIQSIKSSNIRIFKDSNLHTFEYSSIQSSRTSFPALEPDSATSRYSSLQVFNGRTFKHSNLRSFKFKNKLSSPWTIHCRRIRGEN